MTHPMKSREVKAEQREQQPVSLPPKKRSRPKPDKSAQANGGGISSGSAAEPSSLTLMSRTSSSSPPSNDADGNGGQQLLHHEEGGGGGKRPRLVWTTELHDLFVEAYDSLGDEAVPRRILEKMNEKMSIPEVSREKVASHLQKHKLHLRRLAEEASSQNSPTEEAPAASQPNLRSLLPPNTTSPLAQLELVQQQQVLQKTPPPDCLSRSSSSIAANLQIVQSSIQQQLLGPPPPSPIKEGPGETMMQLDSAGCSTVEGQYGWCLETKLQHMETSTTAAILVPEANTEEEAVMIRMAQAAAKAENAAAEAEEEAAPAAGSILAQFWASPDNQASSSTSSWDIFARNVTQ